MICQQCMQPGDGCAAGKHLRPSAVSLHANQFTIISSSPAGLGRSVRHGWVAGGPGTCKSAFGYMHSADARFLCRQPSCIHAPTFLHFFDVLQGACTFGPRLSDEDIQQLAAYVLAQAQAGWPTPEQQ